MEKIKALIGLTVIVAGFYVAWNLIPPYFHNGQFQEELDDVVRHASYTLMTDDQLKKHVVEKAKDMDIVLKEDQVTISHGEIQGACRHDSASNRFGLYSQFAQQADIIETKQNYSVPAG